MKILLPKWTPAEACTRKREAQNANSWRMFGITSGLDKSGVKGGDSLVQPH